MKKHRFESNFHYLKVTCAVENKKNHFFESDYLENCILKTDH